jgi:hypothetical protein
MRAWTVLLVSAVIGASACSDDDSDDGTGGSSGSGGSAGSTGGSAGSTGGSAGSTGGSAGQNCGGAGASDCVDPCTGQFYGPSCVDGGWTCTGPLVCDGGNDA